METPTPAQIKAEVSRLREMKHNVRHYTAFGDDNWAAVQAQIDVLEYGYDEDTIYDRYQGDADNVRGSALEALYWMQGMDEYEGETPSEDWKSLLIGEG